MLTALLVIGVVVSVVVFGILAGLLMEWLGGLGR